MRSKALAQHFKTIDAIKNADIEELKKIGLNDKTIEKLKERLNEEIEFE